MGGSVPQKCLLQGLGASSVLGLVTGQVDPSKLTFMGVPGAPSQPFRTTQGRLAAAQGWAGPEAGPGGWGPRARETGGFASGVSRSLSQRQGPELLSACVALTLLHRSAPAARNRHASVIHKQDTGPRGAGCPGHWRSGPRHEKPAAGCRPGLRPSLPKASDPPPRSPGAPLGYFPGVSAPCQPRASSLAAGVPVGRPSSLTLRSPPASFEGGPPFGPASGLGHVSPASTGRLVSGSLAPFTGNVFKADLSSFFSFYSPEFKQLPH